MNTSTISSAVRYRVMRRLHPIQRAGWVTVRTASTSTQTVVGVALFAIGAALKRSRTRTLLYGTTLAPGGSVQIRVFSGDTMLSDTTVEH